MEITFVVTVTVAICAMAELLAGGLSRGARERVRVVLFSALSIATGTLITWILG